MRKKFKAKRKYIFKFKYIIYILILFGIYQISFFFFNKINLIDSNDEFIKYMLSDSNHYIKYDNEDLENNFIKILTNINLKKPVSILKTSFYDYGDEDIIYEDNYDKSEKKTIYVENPNPNTSLIPKVYIYNSHQLENYRAIDGSAPNVLMAAYNLKNKLESINIPTIVEETNMTDFMNSNNWQHKDSYVASRYLVKDVLNKYKSLELLIDLHRDSITYNNSVITINNKKYAKVLFVVGTEYSTYKNNLELANKFNNLINSKYPYLSRGVITKSGAYVNGVYNQDLSSNMVLIECGGYENTMDEVNNTIAALSEIIKIYLEG